MHVMLKKNKNTVNDDLMYYGVPRVCVKCFIETSPIVSIVFMILFLLKIFLSLTTDDFSNSLYQCIGNTKITKSKQQPLKMILSKNVGSRYQMDLIEMPPVQGFRYILRIVDHLSFVSI
jgi:hypothetical protein